MPSIEHLNPPGLLQLESYSQVVVASGGRTAYIAGQGAFDEKMQLIGRDDLHAQTVQAFRNLCTCLAALGVGPERVVSSNMYVVGLDDARTEQFIAAMNVALNGQPFPPNASTLVGVTPHIPHIAELITFNFRPRVFPADRPRSARRAM